MCSETYGFAILGSLPDLNETNLPIPPQHQLAAVAALREKCDSNICGHRDNCRSIIQIQSDDRIWIYSKQNGRCIPDSCAVADNTILVGQDGSVRLAF